MSETKQQTMIEVSKERFYAIMGPLNVHPRTLNHGSSEWIMQTNHALVGKITRETWESPEHCFVSVTLAA